MRRRHFLPDDDLSPAEQAEVIGLAAVIQVAAVAWRTCWQETDRIAAMTPFRLDEEKLALAEPGCRVLHCLPAHRGSEITSGVLDGPASLAWDQAENRLHWEDR